MSCDSLSDDVFEVLCHDEAQQIEKSSLSHFFKKISFRGNTVWAQFCPKLHNLLSHNCSRDFFKYSCMIWCNSRVRTPPPPRYYLGCRILKWYFFWGLSFFEILGEELSFRGAVSPMWDLVLFD